MTMIGNVISTARVAVDVATIAVFIVGVVHPHHRKR